jgi:hypothetical protein
MDDYSAPGRCPYSFLNTLSFPLFLVEKTHTTNPFCLKFVLIPLYFCSLLCFNPGPLDPDHDPFCPFVIVFPLSSFPGEKTFSFVLSFSLSRGYFPWCGFFTLLLSVGSPRHRSMPF